MAASSTTLRRIGFTAVAFGLFVGGAELAARLYEYITYGTMHVDGAPIGLYGPPDPHGGRTLQPGASLEGSAGNIHVNSMGFRGVEISAQKPPNTVRVWCLGGSTTFDILATEDFNTWPAKLEAHLREKVAPVNVEVINAGIPGEHVNTNLRDLRRKGPGLSPDLVIIHQGPNDLRSIANQKFPPIFPKPSLVSGMSAYRVLWDFLPPPLPNNDWADRTLDVADMGELRRGIDNLVSEAQRQGALPVIASHGFAASKDGGDREAWWRLGRDARGYGLTPTGLVRAYEAMNGMFSDIAAQRGVPFVDLRNAVGTDPEHWGDGIHFSDAGADRAGRLLADALVDGNHVQVRRR